MKKKECLQKKIDEARERILSPLEFKRLLCLIWAEKDGGTNNEWNHETSDLLIGNVLISLGYEKGIQFFDKQYKEYSY